MNLATKYFAVSNDLSGQGCNFGVVILVSGFLPLRFDFA